MRPSSWHPPVEPSSFEQNILTRIKRATLFVFLRHHRHELFDDAFQEEQDWDQLGQREKPLSLVLNVLQAVEIWVQTLPPEDAQLAQPSLDIAQQIQAQDVEVDEKGKASLIKGVAKDRRISVEDAEMRHGWRSPKLSELLSHAVLGVQ